MSRLTIPIQQNWDDYLLPIPFCARGMTIASPFDSRGATTPHSVLRARGGDDNYAAIRCTARRFWRIAEARHGLRPHSPTPRRLRSPACAHCWCASGRNAGPAPLSKSQRTAASPIANRAAACVGAAASRVRAAGRARRRRRIWRMLCFSARCHLAHAIGGCARSLAATLAPPTSDHERSGVRSRSRAPFQTG